MSWLEEEIEEARMAMEWNEAMYGFMVARNLRPDKVCTYTSLDPLYLTHDPHFWVTQKFKKRLRRLIMMKGIANWIAEKWGGFRNLFSYSPAGYVIPQVMEEDTYKLMKAPKKSSKKVAKKATKKTAKKAAKKAAKKSSRK